MNNLSRTCRVAEYTALSLLRSSGYYAEKITGRGRRFDIIAWDHEHILGLVIRTSRTDGIAGYPSIVADLARFVEKNLFPGRIEVWILRTNEWRRYEVLPGGAFLKPWREP